MRRSLGCGGLARHRAQGILADFRNTSIPVVCEPSGEAFERMAALFEEAGRSVPVNVPDLAAMLEDHADQLDAAYVVTPHVLHFSQADVCLKAGLDVLVEKPMVMNAEEARALIETRDSTGRTLTVAFQGSLLPHVRKASRDDSRR